MPDLLPQHYEQLVQGSGIAPEIIAARGYRSLREYRSSQGTEDFEALLKYDFSKRQAALTPGLLIPILSREGQPVLYQLRPDKPRIDGKGRPIKYETPKGARMHLDFATGQEELLGNPAIPIWIIEGIKKVDAARSHGFCAIGLLGVWNWRGKNDLDGTLALPDWEDIALKGREVFIAFDSDVTTKLPVQEALKRLQGFLANRGGRPQVVLLPAEGDKKTGLDDYLLTHTADELRALADGNNLNGGEAAEGVLVSPYRATDRGLQWRKVTRDGTVWILLTNFQAKITSDIVRDDGAERIREFEIEATMQSRSSHFVIPARQFDSMSWATEHLGAHAIIFPGQTVREHAAVAIRKLSDVIPDRRIFTHTGWRRNRDGQWYFFHGAGVLGVNGHEPNMEVALPSGLERLILPEPPRGDGLRLAVQASLDLLNVAPEEVSVPPWGAIWRAPLGDTDVGVHLAGPTGSGKTELAALAQQHFGAGFDARHLPGSWLSTGNALEALAFAAKDVLLTIDDFAPGGTSSDVARTHREADRVLRASGNQAGRGRLRPDGTMRPIKPPRGLILSTGEDVPRGQSLRARLLVVEVSPSAMNWPHLSICQEAAAVGVYAQAMAGYLHWLAPRFETVRSELPVKIRYLQRASYQADQHRRTATNIASLAVGISYFLAFAADVAAISSEMRETYWTRCWAALLRTAEQQGQHQEAHEPTRHFLSLISGTIASGRAHVAAPDGLAPQNPGAWGWREHVVGTGDFTREEWQPQGRRVGWTDADNLYLEPEASYAEAQELARQAGDSLGVSRQTLSKRLNEKNLLIGTGKDEGRETWLARKTLEGRRRSVLHVNIASLDVYTSQKPDHPDHPDHVENDQRNGQVLWSSFCEITTLSDQGLPTNCSDLANNGQGGQVFMSDNKASSERHPTPEKSWSGGEKNLTNGTKKPDHNLTTEKRREDWTFPRWKD